MKTFQESFNNGILSKTQFQNSEITQDFIRWLIPFINGSENKLKLIDLHYGGKYNNFNEAIYKYKWPLKSNGLNFKETTEKFAIWREKLKSSDQEQLLNTCKEILKWGRIPNHKKLESIKNLHFFLNHMNQKLSQDEIIIYDLNSSYINSGFTKIYAALNETFIMYDGRVGAALCYLIRSYLERDGKNKKAAIKTMLPAELNFGWGWGMGEVDKRKNRNPNSDKSTYEKFEEIEKNRELHFISNIKANWLLEIIAQDKAVEIIDCTEKVFALQTALFVLGENLPSA